jgi:preprotein translocase subunit SecD
MLVLKEWRFWLSLLLVLFCFYFIKPNFTDNQDFKINFGLDIQGGYSYLLELNEEEYLNNLLTKTSQAFENDYNIESFIDQGTLFIPSNQDLEKINNILLQNIGLEEEDKSPEGITYKISKKSFNQSLSDMTLNAVEIVRSRVDFLGNKELSIQKVGLIKYF